MKTYKKLAVGALALVTAGAASAQTVIRIVGSNGDRTATQTAISKLLDAGWTFQGTGGQATSASLPTATAANFGAWNGSYGGNPVVIKVSFSGALAGIAAVAGNTDQRFVVSNGTGTANLVNPISTGAVAGTDYELGKADFGFSTNFQTTSPYNGVFEGVTYNTVVEEIVGVSPLAFYASPGFPADNITTQQAQLLYSNGVLSVGLFTGDLTADGNKLVYAIGRDTNAGQRFGAYAEVGLGTASAVKVWQPVVSGSTTTGGVISGGTVQSQVLWPAETKGGIFSPLGSGGFDGGATLAPVLTTTLTANAYRGAYYDEDIEDFAFLYPNATAGYYIGYLTPGDGRPRVLGVNATTGAVTGNIPVQNRGKELKYNGVALTDANVQNGSYTAWLYNRILKPQSGLVGLKLTFANALRDQIKNTDAPSGGGLFDNATFKVKRFTDGGLVVPK